MHPSIRIENAGVRTEDALVVQMYDCHADPDLLFSLDREKKVAYMAAMASFWVSRISSSDFLSRIRWNFSKRSMRARS